MAILPTSYTSQTRGMSGFLRESYGLYRSRGARGAERVRMVISKLRIMERTVEENFGLKLRNLAILDVGCGQLLTQLIFFARNNTAVGIDWDVITEGHPWSYVSMFRENGARRVIKTLGRKALGIDRRHRAAILEALGLRSMPAFTVLRMDACNMTFGDESFDFVHSYSVFHHLEDPEAAIQELNRVMKPRAVGWLSLHLFTSETGCLEFRDIRDKEGKIVRWPHLRREFADKVYPNAYLNRLRLRDWRKLFEQHMPGATIILNRTQRPGIEADASRFLRAEPSDYSSEELLTGEVIALWRKP
jgi:SAM-dependent methyltransferase